MNEQDEILVRQSNWSGRRVVLLYWFAIVFLGTAAAAGLGSTVLDPKYRFEAVDDTWHAAIGDPWHPDDCAGGGCHDDVIADWSGTWHAEIVGENDTSNNALNGSKVSFNSTHYWRTPNTPTDPLDLTNMTNLQIWNYTELFNASGQQCCMTTRWYNVTGDPTNPLYENMTSNIWDIGVSCAACHPEPGVKSLSYTVCSGCHTPGGMQWMSYWGMGRGNHYNTISGLLASGDVNTLTDMEHYIGQSTYMNVADLNASDYYTVTCVSCHDPHDSSTNDGDVSNAMSPWTNVYTGEVFGPGGSQLRAATVNDLCGTCHEVSLDTSTAYFTDPSDHTSLGCTDCHGYQWEPGHNATDRFGVVSWVNETFSSLDHNFAPPDDADDCGLCHTTDNATVWADMQTYLAQFGNLTDAKALYDTKLAEATAKYDEASSTVGVDTSSLANAQALIEEAEDLVPMDGTFHDPLSSTAEQQLALAVVKLDEAIVEADAAIAGAVNPTVTVDHTVEVNVTVDHTVEKPVTVDHTVEKTIVQTTTTSAPAIGFLAVLGILGATAFLVRKRRR